MTFRETLDKHLQAIQNRDLTALAETLPADEVCVVMSDGKVVKSVKEFVDAHRGWFAMTNWQLGISPVCTYETAEMGVAVMQLDYREDPPGRDPVRQASMLTLVFQQKKGRWVMVLDQNTPVRVPAA